MAHVLVIDDTAAVRDTVKQMLERGGHSVATAANGRAGLALARRERFDLVMTDMLMPDTDGIETIKLLGALPEPPKILAMSGSGQSLGIDLLKIGSMFGADAALAKPFGKAELLELVQRLVGDAADNAG